MSPFIWRVRTYWEDTDAGGIVYYANYLKFMERARSEWLRAIGIEQGPLQSEHGLMFVVVSAESHFRRPARYGDLLLVSCEVEKSTRASLTFKQDIFRDPAGAERDPAGAERDPAGAERDPAGAERDPAEAEPDPAEAEPDPAGPGGDAEHELLVTGRVRVACLDAAKFRPRALPDLILQELGIAGDLND